MRVLYAAGRKERGRQRMTIALIEDDEAILRSLSMLLESRGIPVRPYSSAESFLEAAPLPRAIAQCSLASTLCELAKPTTGNFFGGG